MICIIFIFLIKQINSCWNEKNNYLEIPFNNTVNGEYSILLNASLSFPDFDGLYEFLWKCFFIIIYHTYSVIARLNCIAQYPETGCGMHEDGSVQQSLTRSTS